MTILFSKCFDAANLTLVDPAPRCAPTLAIGERVQLRSGGPEMLVVDIGIEHATTSYREKDDCVEIVFPTACLRKIIS